MREAILQLIEDYQWREESALDMLVRSDLSSEQYQRVNGKRMAYRDFIRELKEVLSQHGTNDGS